MVSAVAVLTVILNIYIGFQIPVPVFKNKFVVTVAVVFVAYLIGATDRWQKIGPIFGATNQLITAVALFVVATWLMAVKKPTQYVLYPAIFMVITTIGALGWQAWRFFTAPEPNRFLGGTAVIFIGLAVLSKMRACRH